MKKYLFFLAVLVFCGACSATENNSENLTDAEAFTKLIGGKNVYIGPLIKGYFSADGTEFKLWGPNAGDPYTLNRKSVKNNGTSGFSAFYEHALPSEFGKSFSSVTENGGKYGSDEFTFNAP